MIFAFMVALCIQHILLPSQRVVLNIFGDACMIVGITHHMFIIIALPDMLVEGREGVVFDHLDVGVCRF